MTSTRLVVDLPHHNNDREGILADIHASLNRLSHVSSAIFERVENRIKQEATKLDSIEKRIQNVQTTISSIATQPSKGFTLTCVTKLPTVDNEEWDRGLFGDLPNQKLGEGETPEYLYKGRKNVSEIDDPTVPIEALFDLDRRIVANVSTLIQNGEKEYENIYSDIEEEINFLNNPQNNLDQVIFDQAPLGPAPESLKSLKKGFSPSNTHIAEGKEVEYRPTLKEVHQLGLPSNLGGFLPDIAEDTPLFKPLHPSQMSRSLSPLLIIQDEVVTSGPPSSPIQKNNKLSTLLISPDKKIAEEYRNSNDVEESEPIEPKKLLTGGSNNENRQNLLAAIREKKALKPSNSQKNLNKEEPAKRQTSLADEMREKLLRRQKALSGEKDEEEQEEERRRKGRTTWTERSSDAGSSLPSIKQASSGSSRKRNAQDRNQDVSLLQNDSSGFAGIDALLRRELASKSSIIRPPKPPSSAGDWDSD